MAADSPFFQVEKHMFVNIYRKDIIEIPCFRPRPTQNYGDLTSPPRVDQSAIWLVHELSSIPWHIMPPSLGGPRGRNKVFSKKLGVTKGMGSRTANKQKKVARLFYNEKGPRAFKFRLLAWGPPMS
jgi:hypothetical protein